MQTITKFKSYARAKILNKVHINVHNDDLYIKSLELTAMSVGSQRQTSNRTSTFPQKYK